MISLQWFHCAFIFLFVVIISMFLLRNISCYWKNMDREFYNTVYSFHEGFQNLLVEVKGASAADCVSPYDECQQSTKIEMERSMSLFTDLEDKF